LFPAVMEKVDVALKSYFLTLASEPELTNPDEVDEAINHSQSQSFSISARLRPQMVYRTGP